MEKILLTPPVAFLIIFGVLWLLSSLSKRLAFRPKKIPNDVGESYACGESNYDHMAQPDYSTFFPFAFFLILEKILSIF